MKQSLQHLFSQIPRADIQRSVFDRHHTVKSAFDTGYLVPIFVDEALPGDTFSLNLSVFGRLSTMAVPIMDNLYMETFFFAVPVRLVWDNFQKFMGERKNPDDSIDYVLPTLSPESTADVGSLSDYFGLPINVKLRNVTSLWHRAYNLIYNEWFRDENLIDSAIVDRGDGPDLLLAYPLRKRRKAKDYFTGCLPWPQKGPGMSIPIGSTAPVWGDGYPLAIQPGYLDTYGGASQSLLRNHQVATINDPSVPTDAAFVTYGTSGYGVRAAGDVPSGLYADLSNATAVTINQLREAFQIQRLLEADARGGTRYTEILRSHFSVVSPDARLQRPEYLGGSSCRIAVHPVAQQSSTDSITPQGNLAAYATMGDVQHIFTKSFTEHTLLLGIVNVRADLTYQQGTPRMFSRRTRYDFYWPTLAHLGEQAVLNKEIYTADDGTDAKIAQDNAVFGYQERWAEYRDKPSMITGKMRSTASTSLDVWHLAQKFTELPVLNQSFVEEDVPLSRVLAVTNEPQIIFDADFDLRCARPMPVYSVPGLIDHF